MSKLNRSILNKAPRRSVTYRNGAVQSLSTLREHPFGDLGGDGQNLPQGGGRGWGCTLFFVCLFFFQNKSFVELCHLLWLNCYLSWQSQMGWGGDHQHFYIFSGSFFLCRWVCLSSPVNPSCDVTFR